MNTPQTYVANGTLLSTEGKFQQAIQMYKEAIQLQPHHLTAFLDLGNTYIKTNKFDLAIEAFTKAIDINPYISNVYRGLGNAYRFKGDYANALKNYQIALQHNDKISQIYDDIGLLYIKSQNDHHKALQNFEQAIKLDGFNLQALNNASRSYIALGDPQKATLYNEKALLINPNCHDAQQIKTSLQQC